MHHLNPLQQLRETCGFLRLVGVLRNQTKALRPSCAVTFALCASLFLASACSKDAPAPIVLVWGSAANERVELTAVSAFARLVEVPGVRSELSLAIGNYAFPCGNFTSPSAEQILLNVHLALPSETQLTTGIYNWENPGDAAVLSGPRLFATLQIGSGTHAFLPGGFVELKQLNPGSGGILRGNLALEYPGDLLQPASSVKGPFTAKWCGK